ncbi:MAG: DNA primase [Candidatus Paceibacterota bacterium]|jgi:DNA primase
MSSSTEQIKEKLDIVDVISSYIKVEKAGVNFKARCPFHNEKTPSFLISPNRQTFYCFGCQEKGDIFSFVEKFEGLDFKGALETLANRAGIKLEKFKNENPETASREQKEKERMFEIMEEATKFFEKNLPKNQENLKYLEGRGLNSASITKWRLGFALDEWRSLFDYLTAQKFSKEEMLGAGLIKKAAQPSPEATAGKAGQDKYYDTFRNRIIFPLCDSTGRVIAFSGRAMKEDDKTPKYLNSPETKLFYKSEALYGFDVAKNYIRKLDYTVLVEGQMDLVMSHQVGVFNTVASSGTALTELHLKKLQKLSNRVIIGYDSDLAGEKAGIRSAELALNLGMEAKIASLPKGEDPASVAKTDPEKWKEALKKSEHFTDFILNKAVRENEGRNLTREILKNVLPIASFIKSEIEKSQFIKKIAQKMRVNEETVWDDFKKIKENPKHEIEQVEMGSLNLKKTSLERIMVGLVYLEELQDQKSPTKEKWVKILGQSRIEEIFDNYKENQEALIFEAEMHASGGDLEKTKADILQRLELQNLKQQLQRTAMELDDKNILKEAEDKIKTEIDKIQKHIKEINK